MIMTEEEEQEVLRKRIYDVLVPIGPPHKVLPEVLLIMTTNAKENGVSPEKFIAQILKFVFIVWGEQIDVNELANEVERVCGMARKVIGN